MKKTVLVDGGIFWSLLKLALIMSCLFMNRQFCSQALASEGLTPEKIKNQFIKEGKLSAVTEVKKVITPQSLFAEQIIIFNSDTCKSVAKVFKKLDNFMAENKKITKMQTTIELINEQHKCLNDLPIISSRKGEVVIEDVGIILFEKAKGKTLDEAYFHNPSSIENATIIEAFTSIGVQFGALDKFMYEGKQEVLIQGDSRGANFMYDEKNHQLYWIDLDELALENSASGITKIKFLDNLLLKAGFDKLTNFGTNHIFWEIDVPHEKAKELDTISELGEYIPYLKYISNNKLLKLKVEFAKLMIKMHKEFLVVKSFGEGYVSAYPEGKAAYDMWLEKKKNYNLFSEKLKEFNKFEKALGLPETH